MSDVQAPAPEPSWVSLQHQKVKSVLSQLCTRTGEVLGLSLTTGLTVVVVHSSTDQPVSLTARASLVTYIPHLVLVNSYGTGSLLLGVDTGQTHSDLDGQLVRASQELPGLVFTYLDVSVSDPFACLYGWPVIPRVDQTGLYQTIVRSKDAGPSLDSLLSGYNVEAGKQEGEVIVQVSHVLESIAFSDWLEKEPGVSVESCHTWRLQPREKTGGSNKEAVSSDSDRAFWVRVTDSQFNSLNVAHKQHNLKVRLSSIGRVRQLESRLFGINNNYLAVLSGCKKFSRSDLCDIILVELPLTSLPAGYIPSFDVDKSGFYKVTGRFPDRIDRKTRLNFAEDIKRTGAVGFTGGEPEFCLYFVNSRAAESAFSLSYSSFNLKILPSKTEAPSKEKQEEDVDMSCQMTETELLAIDWQQGRSLSDALKSLAKFLVSIDVVEVMQQEDTEVISFKIADRKNFMKILKIYSRNDTNSIEKLRHTAPKLAIFAHKFNQKSANMFGLAKKKELDRTLDKEFLDKMELKYQGFCVEERLNLRIFWTSSKLEFYKALTDKTLNAGFVPNIGNWTDVKTLSRETQECFQLTEKTVFGLLGKNLSGGLDSSDEKVISRQLTNFIKNSKCSDVTDEEDCLVFHFSGEENFNTILAKYCPDIVGDQKKLESLTRNFVFIPSKGNFGIFSSNPVDPQDFQDFSNYKFAASNRNIWFRDKMEAIRLLRDPTLSRMYPNLNISYKNIRILSDIAPQTQTPIPFNQQGFGSSRSKLNPSVPSFYPRQKAKQSADPVDKTSLRRESAPHQQANYFFLKEKEIFRKRRIEDAASDIRDILQGKENLCSTSLYDLKKRGIELQLRERLGVLTKESEVGNMEEDIWDVSVGDDEKEALCVDVPKFNALIFPCDAYEDDEFLCQLKQNISWFEAPVSMQFIDKSVSGGQRGVRVIMKTTDVATIVYHGLKGIYPEVEMDQSGA